MSKNIIKKTKDYLVKLPDCPGVYLFLDSDNKPLYIGKATSLRDRVRSYFSLDLVYVRSALVQKVVDESDSIEWIETDSALEALILESNLIKKYQPYGNTLNVDDKTYNYVVFTNEDYPRIFTVRGHELSTVYDPDEFKYVFGPYVSGTSLIKALRLIRNIFPYRGKKDPVRRTSQHSPLNEQIGLVPDLTDVDKLQYSRLINNLRLFFEGKKSALVKSLNQDMKLAAKEMRFEDAAKIRNTLFALDHINDTTLIGEDFVNATTESNSTFVIESYDIAHTMGESMVGVMVVMEGDLFNKARYRKFNIKKFKSANDTGALRQMLERRLDHNEWPLPDIFVVDGGQAQYNVFIKTLEKVGVQIPVVAVTKGDGHKPKGYIGDSTIIKEHEDMILRSNAEAHRFAITWHRSKQRKERFK